MFPVPTMVAVMTPAPHYIDASSSLSTALDLMERYGIRHLPVFEKGDLAGILSARDLERAKMPGHPLRDETELTVGDICRRRPYFVDVADPLDKVLEAMAEKRIGSALVLREGELAGMFTAMDACQLLAQMLRNQWPAQGPGAPA